MFNMYDKIFYKRDVTCSWPPSPVTNCHTYSDPLPSSVTYFMDGPSCARHAWRAALLQFKPQSVINWRSPWSKSAD